ncbi:MAG TPA: glycosyltransferase family 1 protein [Methylothermaceae bacterium]|nr:glycosyltransferase family 1 protein [Methylothermaceae bacterium]
MNSVPRRLHICYVEFGYPHPHGSGGAGTYVQLVGRELVRLGHQVSVVAAWCSQCPHRIEDEGVTVYRPRLQGALHWYLSKIPGLRVGALALRYLERGLQLYRFLEDLNRIHPIDVIEFTEGGDFWHAFHSRIPFLTHLHGSRYTVRVQSGRPTNRADWLHRRLELAFIRRAPVILSPSQALLDIVRDEAGGFDSATWAIPLPVDPELLRPRAAENSSQFQSENKIVLFAARNDPVKGVDILLKAIPLVHRRVPEVGFRLFGYQPDPGQHLPEGVTCFPFVPKQELLAQYHHADLVVVPSCWDNSPNTVYEAMAAGKAVVASHVGGIPELVVDGETGLLVPSGDFEALADAIVQLLLAHEVHTRMGRRGRERIVQLADLQRNVDQRLAIYWRLMDTSSRLGTPSPIR